MNEHAAGPCASWAVVELLGHVRLAGYTTETTIAGGGFVRVQIPDAAVGFTGEKLCGPGSIYAITPCTEEAARNIACPPKWSPTRYPAIEATETYHGDIDDDFDEDLDDQDEDDDDGGPL
jgi:hypothetical protein